LPQADRAKAATSDAIRTDLFIFISSIQGFWMF
jgi:hypothetical protein